MTRINLTIRANYQRINRKTNKEKQNQKEKHPTQCCRREIWCHWINRWILILDLVCTVEDDWQKWRRRVVVGGGVWGTWEGHSETSSGVTGCKVVFWAWTERSAADLSDSVTVEVSEDCGGAWLNGQNLWAVSGSAWQWLWWWSRQRWDRLLQIYRLALAIRWLDDFWGQKNQQTKFYSLKRTRRT